MMMICLIECFYAGYAAMNIRRNGKNSSIKEIVTNESFFSWLRDVEKNFNRVYVRQFSGFVGASKPDQS